MMTHFKRNLTGVSLGALCLATAGTAFAQETSGNNEASRSARVAEEIIVTATKRKQSLQEISVAVSVVDGQRVANLGISTLDQLTSLIPSVMVSDAQVTTNLFIRGVGSGQNYGFEQSVGVFIDGVAFSRARSARAPFFDVERVEVLKGPQSVLFGKNVVAGAFNITTARPTDDWERSVSLEWTPEFDGVDMTGIVSGPISDNMQVRLAGKYSDIDGYIKNTFPGAPNPGGREEYIIRGTVELEPSENFSVTLKGETSKLEVKGGLAVTPTLLAPSHLALLQAVDPLAETNKDYQTSAPGTNDPFNNMFNNTKTDNLTLSMTLGLGEFELNSVSSYIRFATNQRTNNDHVNLDVVSGPERHNFRSFAQELRLYSPSGEFLDYVVGGYFSSDRLRTARVANVDLSLSGLAGVFGVDQLGRNQRFLQDNDTWAAFAQGTLNISEDLRVVAGIRYTKDKKTVDKEMFYSALVSDVRDAVRDEVIAAAYNGVLGVEHSFQDIKLDTGAWTPEIKLEYDVTDDMLVYAAYTEGFKAGGFDEDYLSNDITNFAFADEEVKSYALGLKFTVLGGAGYVNAELFRSDFTNLQVSTFSVSSFLVGNAGAARSQGLDIDTRFDLSDDFSIGGSLVLLDGKYRDYTTGPCVLDDAGVEVAQFCDLSGSRLQFAPKTSGAIYAKYQLPISENWGLEFYADATYSSSFATAGDLDPLSVQSEYVKMNASISIANQDRYRISLIVNNLTDVLTSHQANDIPLAVFFGGKGFDNFIDPPRMVSIRATAQF